MADGMTVCAVRRTPTPRPAAKVAAWEAQARRKVILLARESCMDVSPAWPSFLGSLTVDVTIIENLVKPAPSASSWADCAARSDCTVWGALPSFFPRAVLTCESITAEASKGVYGR